MDRKKQVLGQFSMDKEMKEKPKEDVDSSPLKPKIKKKEKGELDMPKTWRIYLKAKRPNSIIRQWYEDQARAKAANIPDPLGITETDEKVEVERRVELPKPLIPHTYGERNERFSSKEAVEMSIAIHETEIGEPSKKKKPETPFVCGRCNKGCQIARGLKIHTYAMHAGRDNLPWDCVICGKRFELKSHLKQHWTVHMGYRYACDKCGLAFKWKCMYSRHSRKCSVSD